METVWIVKIFADYVMAESRRVEIALKYSHEDVLLPARKGKLSGGPCNFLYGEKWIGQISICKPSPKGCFDLLCACFIGCKQSHQSYSPRSIQLLHRPNSQVK